MMEEEGGIGGVVRETLIIVDGISMMTKREKIKMKEE